MQTSRRVLVTGGAGYIGSVLVPALLSNGYKVDVLDTFSRGDTSLASCCSDPNFTPHKGDVRDEAIVRELVAKADIIIPLAALVGAPICKVDPLNAQTVNADSIVMLTRLISSNQLIIYPTTNSGYGIGVGNQHCTEETPLNPISLYGTSKVEAERAVLDSGNGVTLRLATVFGMAPRMRLDLLVNDFTWRAVSDRAVVIFEGHFKRNYIHVKDIANVFLHTIEHYSAMKGQPFNVGLSDANLSKIELCERIRRQIPSFVYLEAPIGEDPDKRNYIVSNAKIEATGFKTKVSIDEGIRELIKGYCMLRNGIYSNI